MPTPYCFIYATAGSSKEAKRIGRCLVEERLAACVNIFPIQSIYRWGGKVERAREVVLIAKTNKKLVEKITRRIRELHSYEVPCIVSFNIERGFKKFLRWIDESAK